MRRWMLAALVVAAGARAATATPPITSPDPVNLLRAAPSTVAVSSTVANSAIKPEHLVDGDLTTAWNSRTGELVGAWIAFRVPADAHVTSIRMTAGFTRADKAGDLFTLNPRVHKVRVTRAGKILVEQELDTKSRALQDIAIDAAGGDFKIEVTDVLAGSKPTWRETCVSELEVWGTLAPAQAPVASTPAVRVGSLDAELAPSFDDCTKLVFPGGRGGRVGPDASDDWISGWDALGTGAGLAVCRVDHRATGSPDTTVELAAVKHGKRWTLLGRQAATITNVPPDPNAMGAATDGTVTLAPFELTATESALLVEVHQGTSGAMHAEGGTKSTLYRIVAGLEPVLDFESTYSDGESSDRDKCVLQPAIARRGAAMPDLELVCTNTQGRWHHEDPRGNGEFTTESKKRFRWDGSRYAPRP